MTEKAAAKSLVVIDEEVRHILGHHPVSVILSGLFKSVLVLLSAAGNNNEPAEVVKLYLFTADLIEKFGNTIIAQAAKLPKFAEVAEQVKNTGAIN